MPRPKNTEARRAQIVQAFLQVMAERGYEGAATTAVARVAGLTPGLIHYHFQDKEAVLVAAVETLGAEHLARVDAALDHPDPLVRLEAFVDVHLGLGAHADPTALASWVAMGAEAVRRPRVQAAYRAVLDGLLDRLIEVVGAGVAGARLSTAAPRAAAVAAFATIQGYFGLAASAPDRIPPGSAAPALYRMLEGLLRPDRPLGPPEDRA